MRRVATIHMLAMITTTVLFVLTWLAQLDGYKDGEVSAAALIVGIVAFGFLAAGGNIGGANVFVYGVRVLSARTFPCAKRSIRSAWSPPSGRRPSASFSPEPTA